MNIPESQLENHEYASFAWDRYKRLMWWMALASTLTTVFGLGALRMIAGPIPWQMMLFTALGIFFSVLLAAVLMGLVFLSAGSGHDETIIDAFAKNTEE
ncbi:MAG: hypothetical protein AABY88_11910 [Pseudomonadota bacterium]